jgi:DNA cross-link repair 1A protein
MFPTQEKTIDTLTLLIRKLETGKSIETIVRNQRTIMSWLEPANISQNPKILLVIGTYTIGKEKIALRLAQNLDCLIYASESKREIWGLLDDVELSKRLTSDSNSARIHIVKMDQLNKVSLADIAQKHADIDLVLAIKPTVISDISYFKGWTYNIQKSEFSIKSLSYRRLSDSIILLSIPYSEHSSYEEINNFLRNITVKRIFPTVRSNSKDKSAFEKFLKSFTH